MSGKRLSTRELVSAECRTVAKFVAASWLLSSLPDFVPRPLWCKLPSSLPASERRFRAAVPNREPASITSGARLRSPSRFRAFVVARDRLAEIFLPGDFTLRVSLAAFWRVAAEVVPSLGGGNFTPARRAFDRPMAMACLVEAAPCLPSRMWSISSFTNSPACVLGDFPSRASSCARSSVSLIRHDPFSRA
jgi:hypothetical protein